VNRLHNWLCSSFRWRKTVQDSLQSLLMPLIHLGDTPLPVDPNTFCARLEAAGFQVLKIEKNSEAFPFQARRLSARR
jgi:hypothetical protein